MTWTFVRFCCEACRQKAGEIPSCMIVCQDCGNKRCPRAENHEFRCTGSNAVGQVGVKDGDLGPQRMPANMERIEAQRKQVERVLAAEPSAEFCDE